jgi:hypothetical protein
MRIVAVIFGIVLIVLVALDAFESVILPRRVTRRIRLAVHFYRTIRFGWFSLAHLMRSSASNKAYELGPIAASLEVYLERWIQGELLS